MSFYRHVAISMLKQNSKRLAESILKCIVSGDINKYDKFISEYISIANDITVKPDGVKLDAWEYNLSIFEYFPTDYRDSSIMLRELRLSNSISKDFIISQDIIDSVYTVFYKIKKTLIPILVRVNNYNKDDFIKIIDNILDNIVEKR